MFGSRKGLQSADMEIKWVPELQGTHTKYNITYYYLHGHPSNIDELLVNLQHLKISSVYAISISETSTNLDICYIPC